MCNSAQCYVPVWLGKEFEAQWIHIYVWLNPFTFHVKLSQHCLLISYQFCSVQSFSRVQLVVTPWITASQPSLSITNNKSLLKLMSIDAGHRWYRPAISFSVVPFSSCPQSLPASGSFPMSQLFTWSGQSIGDSASASVLSMNTQDWSLLGWTGWISL